MKEGFFEFCGMGGAEREKVLVILVVVLLVFVFFCVLGVAGWRGRASPPCVRRRSIHFCLIGERLRNLELELELKMACFSIEGLGNCDLGRASYLRCCFALELERDDLGIYLVLCVEFIFIMWLFFFLFLNGVWEMATEGRKRGRRNRDICNS